MGAGCSVDSRDPGSDAGIRSGGELVGVAGRTRALDVHLRLDHFRILAWSPLRAVSGASASRP
jgi:hypothetical protein